MTGVGVHELDGALVGVDDLLDCFSVSDFLDLKLKRQKKRNVDNK